MLVSNRLPVTVGETIAPSSGGLVSALEGYIQSRDFQWIGWIGGAIDDPVRRRRVQEELEQRYHYHPLFLTPEQVAEFYTGFSNSSLWPLLHYQPGYARYDRKWYATYRHVNGLFAEEIDAQAAPGQLVWIQDYHLMLLPEMLRNRRPDLRVGFFLHTPFPSYEVFRCHPNREDLLNGLLGADLVGFHTSGYLRHFRSTVLRILGLESRMSTIATETHDVSIDVFPISIPAEKFAAEMTSPAFETHLDKYRRIYADKKVVLGVERLDYSKGVLRRLDAIETYLKRSGRRDIVFIFINVPSRENVSAYRRLRHDIEVKVGHINGRFSTITDVPIHFIHQSVAFSELCALYKLADVAMVTPEIDGMNIVAKEYVVCQDDGDGALILSEFAGAAQELHQAYLINPYDVDGMAQALDAALNASLETRRKRMAPMRERVRRYHARRWGETFVRSLEAHSREGRGGDAHPRRLTGEMMSDFLRSSRAALFLDYDGTLSPLRRHPADAAPGDVLHRLFRLFARVGHRIDIYLMSGRGCAQMERWFHGYGMHLVAENGLFYRHPEADTWARFDNNADLGWIQEVADTLQQYSDMTPGSEVEVKTASLVWHYRNSEPEFGRWKAHQMVDELREWLANFPVTIHHGQKIVEVGSMLLNKGVFFQHLKALNRYPRALCAGDDETDESMFRVAEDADLTVKVGEGETAARYAVSSCHGLCNLLRDTLETVAGEQPAT